MSSHTARYGVMWLAAGLLVAASVATGCGGDGQVVVVDPGSDGPVVDAIGPEPVLDVGSADAGPQEAVPVVPQSVAVGGLPDDTERVQGSLPGPSGGPDGGGGPGEGPDGETTGPVGDTGGPVQDGALPGGYAELISPEAVRGGLVLLEEPSLPVQIVNEVIDLCDDADVFLLANERVLEPGDEATDEELFEVTLFREGRGLECDEPGGRRYVYVGAGSWTPAYSTPEEALAHRDRSAAPYADARKQRPKGVLLGYGGLYQREFPLEGRNEVVVLTDTLSVAGGAVRGLVHNLSETQFARNLVVTARPAGSTEADGQGALSWRWPLTVQPGERAPFEIEGWKGGADPANIDLSVVADMSTAVDISRAFRLEEMMVGPIRGNRILMAGVLSVPTSPPGLGEQIQQQTVKDLRVYAAILDKSNARVLDVHRVSADTTVWYGERLEGIVHLSAIDSFPPSTDSLPDDIASRDDLHLAGIPGIDPHFVFGFDFDFDNNDYQVWAGGASPPPAQQPPEQTAG